MRAVFINDCGGYDALVHGTRPLPTRQPGQVLIKSVSIGVNPVDTLVRTGVYRPASFPKILGGDVAGVVEAADEGSAFKPGDAVAALTPGFMDAAAPGCYAEYVVCDEAWVAAVPSCLPLEEAAGMPLVGLTAWQALQGADPQAGQRVLIHGGSGGVGHVAVQIAQALGLHVTAVCGPSNLEFVQSLGADAVVDYSQVGALEQLPAESFDIVLDTRGTRGDALQRSLNLLKPSGHLAHVYNAGTDQQVLGQAKEAHAAGKGPRVGETLVKPSGEQLGRLMALVGEGKLRLTVSASFPLAEAAKAAAQVDGGHTRGKVVLTV